jgi:DNA-binding transcriptional LysR family regulator
MELRDLQCFAAVVETQALSRAARRVHLAQPALSRRIHGLERELGVDLLTRHAKGVGLTAAGAAFARGGAQILAALAGALDSAEATAAGRRGHVVVAVTRAAAARGFPIDVQDAIRSDFPGITLAIRDFEQPTPADAVFQDHADLAVCTESELRPGLESEPLWVETLDQVIVARHNPLATRSAVTLEELSAFPFVFARGTASAEAQSRLAQTLRRAGLRSPVIALDGDLRAAHLMIATEHGWTLISRARAFHAPPEGTVALPIEGLALHVDMTVVWRRDERRAVVLTVLQRMREVARRYPESRVRTAPAGRPRSRSLLFRVPRPTGTVPADLQLRQLRALLAVSTLPSIGRAAARLGIAQPVLSRRLRALEHALGFALLERSARGVALTAAGVSLAGDAASILETEDHLVREVTRARRVVEGRCVIGTVATAAATDLLAQVTARCGAKYPDIQLRVEEMTTPAQRTALLAAQIDLGLAHQFPTNRSRGDGGGGGGILARRVLDDPLEVALVGAGQALARRQEITPADLMDTPFLFADRSFDTAFYDRVLAALAAAGLRPRIDATYDDRAAVWALVAQGKGWTVGFHSQLGRAPVGTVAVRIAGFTVPFGVQLLTRRNESSPHVRAVASLFRALQKS